MTRYRWFAMAATSEGYVGQRQQQQPATAINNNNLKQQWTVATSMGNESQLICFGKVFTSLVVQQHDITHVTCRLILTNQAKLVKLALP
jgi:hypothetical protein